MAISRRVVAFLVFTILMLTFVSPIAAQGDEAKAKVFIQIAEKAREVALQLIERAKAAGEDVSAATLMFDQGSTFLNRAREAYQDKQYDAALANARLSQEEFRDAMKSLRSEPLSLELNKTRLLEAIGRARERIKKVNDAMSNSTEIDTGLKEQISGKLKQSEVLLNEAESILGTGVKNASEAAHKLAQAEKLISEAFVLLRQASHKPKIQRAEATLKALEREISRLEADLDRLEKRGVKVDGLRERLADARNLVQSAEEKASHGNVSGALADIQQAREITQQVRKEIAKNRKP